MKKLIKLLTLATTLVTPLATGPIHKAVVSNDLEEIRSLIKENPSCVNTKGYFGESPLHEAAWRGHTEAAALLIQHGANVFARTRGSYSNTPLNYAKTFDRKETVELLEHSIANALKDANRSDRRLLFIEKLLLLNNI